MEEQESVALTESNESRKEEEETVIISSRKRRRCLCCVILITFLFCSGVSLSNHVILQYTYSRAIRYYTPNATTKHEAKSPCVVMQNVSAGINHTVLNLAQKYAAQWNMYYILADTIPALVLSIPYGVLSDRGRKPVFCLTTLSLTVATAAVVLVIHFDRSLSVIVGAKIFKSCLGPGIAFYVASDGAIADISDSGKSRTLYLALLDSISGLGSFVVTLVLGYYVEAVGYFWPSFTCVGLFALSFLLSCIAFSETVQQGRSGGITSCFKNIPKLVCVNWKKSHHKNCWRFLLCGMAYLLAQMVFTVEGKINTLYLSNEPFCFSSETLDYFFGAKSLAACFTALVVKVLHFFFNNEIIVLVAFVASVGENVIQIISDKTWQIFTVPLLSLFSFPATPVIRGIMSSLTKSNEQGLLFARLSVVAAAGQLLSGFLFPLYERTVTDYPGATYLAMSVCFAVAIIIFIILACKPTVAQQDS